MDRGNSTTSHMIGWGMVGVLGLVFFIIIINFLAIWVRALVSGARVTYLELLALRLRNVPVGMIVDSRINAIKSGLDISIDQLNAHFLAGGNVEMVVRALIMAQKAGINLEFDRACAIDLATQQTGKTVHDHFDIAAGEEMEIGRAHV